MTPAVIALILQYGLQYGPGVIEAIINLFSKGSAGTAPSTDDWNALIVKCSTTARQQMLATLAAHNIDPNSDQGKAFLALTP